MEQFVKLSDIKKALEEIEKSLESMTSDDVYNSICFDLERNIKIYNAEYKPYMPIRIRDYGYMPDGKPHEFDCGADQNHHWLKISNDDGSLSFDHMQNGSGSMNEESAKEWGECCFIPTYEYDNEVGKPERYITPEMFLVLQEERKK